MASKVIAIVGLGNPGKRYQKTRHNFGFLALDEFVRTNLPQAKWILDAKRQAQVIEDTYQGQRLLLMKPQTFMNLSGQAVSALLKNQPLELTDLWLLHDDVDLDLGFVRVRLGGSAAGHNGVQSVVNSIGSPDFWRVRLGIGLASELPLDDYVTMPFTVDELVAVGKVTQRVADILSEALTGGGLQETSYEVD